MAVTEADVRAVMGLPADTSLDISIALQDATLLVNELLAGSSLSSSRIDIITKYLAAHFAQLQQSAGAGVRRVRIGSSEEEYDVGSLAKLTGLRTTVYGQQALALDSTGALSQISATMLPAEFRVL